MDTPQEVDDCRTARRLFRLPRPKNMYASSTPIPGPGLVQSGRRWIYPVHGTAEYPAAEDTVVNGVVEEQDFRRFNKEDASGSMSWTTMKLTPAASIWTGLQQSGQCRGMPE